MTVADLNWTELGHALRQASLDAHGEVIEVFWAYQFLIANPEAFIDAEEWPADMPMYAETELTAAYYGRL